jgi:hypothetical protein
MEPTNEKQKAWKECIDILNKKDLIVLETGRIRNPNWKNSDGNSTDYLTSIDCVSKLYSIDNDSENFSGFKSSEEYCKKTLSNSQIEKIIFINGYSVDSIKNLEDNFFDVVLLDSVNDSEIIFQEFINVIPKLKLNSLVIIDDVTNPGIKGDKVISFLNTNNIPFTKKTANPADCIYFFVDEKMIELIKKNLN